MIKKTLYSLLLCIISSGIVRSQRATTIDSLITLISTQQGITLANTYNELAWEYRYTNDSLAISYAIKAEQLAKQAGDNTVLATSYIRQGTAYLFQHQYTAAKKLLSKALIIEEKENNLFGIARVKTQLAVLYKKQYAYKTAIGLYREALEIQQQLNNSKKVAQLYNNIALLYKVNNDPVNALAYYQKSIQLREEIRDTEGLIKTYKNIGAFYNDQKAYQKAIGVLQKGKTLSIQLQDSIQLAGILLNIGNAYNYLQKLDTAATYFSQSLAIKQQLGVKNIAPVYNNLGMIAEKKNQLDTALVYYTKSIATATTYKDDLQLIDTYSNTAKVYKKKKDYTTALAYYLKALKLAKKHNKGYKELGILTGVGKVYELQNGYEKANFYNEAHIVLRNQLEDTARQQRAAMQLLTEERYQNKILLAEKATATAQVKRKTTQLVALTVGCILIAILFFALFRAYRLQQQNQLALQKEKVKQAEIEELLKAQELKSIHAMIEGQEQERKRIAQDLHDRLGSMLSVVKIHYKSVTENLAKIQTEASAQYEQANKLLDEACVAVREISHNMVSGVLTKFGLIPALQELKSNIESATQIEIELVTYGFDERIANELEITIYRMLQELIGNTLKHAAASEISIQLLKKETMLNLTVIDNGIGFDTSDTTQYTGIGIKGIQSRVENLGGEVFFDSGKGNGTTITIDIPINQLQTL